MRALKMKLNPIAPLLMAVVLASFNALNAETVSVVAQPENSSTNRFYLGNRAPLQASRFIALPFGAVQPQGWLREFLNRQRAGLSGNLGEISGWLQKEDNSWLQKDGKGKYGWEEVPYWLRGYLPLGYILDDAKIIAESKTWIESAIKSQRLDGDFGPDQRFEDGTRDFWGNMLMLYCLQTYHERTGDARVLDLMTRYFRYQNSLPDEKFLTHYWQKMRGGDTIYIVYWLYNHTGAAELLKFADKVHHCTANWKMPGDLPNWHNVNVAQAFREPATRFLQTHDPADMQASYANFHEIRKRYGQVPGGMFGGDENCRPGYDDPRQAVETCGMVEQMFSDNLMMLFSGDAFWGDHCEDVAFNSYPAAVMPDFRALRYLTAPNMVVSDSKNHAPGFDNNGPFLMMNPFSSRCCQHNHSMGWPYFTKHLWFATADNGLCAAVYSASEVTAQVGDGAKVRVIEETKYPFEESIRFTIRTDKAATFPLYLRIPAWCKTAGVSINGRKVSAEAAAGKYIRVEREWKDKDVVTLDLPMEVSLKTWTANHNSVSVNYGPLTFSLKIGERYEKHDSSRTAIGDSLWQKNADPMKWPSFEIHPTTPWNFGLSYDGAVTEKTFAVKRLAWPKDNFPFTPESAPIQIITRGRPIPEWTMDRYGLCAVLQDSPALTMLPVQELTLIPMGAARLRISAFPTASNSSDGRPWKPSPLPKRAEYLPSASHCFTSDTVDAMCDGLEPKNSSDESIPRQTWWDHRGTAEWAQYDFPVAKKISSAEVYWWDDTGHGQCRVPVSARLLYKSGDVWKSVAAMANLGVKKDGWNRVEFPAVETKALRLEVQLQKGFSGGVLDWKVK